jgi:molybdate transport system permease protein
MNLIPNDFWTPLLLSLKIASISVIFVLALGTLLGRLLARRRFRGKILLETMLLLPIVLPPTVIGFLLIFIFGSNSPVGAFLNELFSSSIIFTPAAAVIASSIVAFPLMYQTVKIGFQSIDKDIENAARVDGASEMEVFIYVTLPLSINSIISGFVLSFARALGEFGATFMFAGNIPGKTQTAPIAIYIAMESGNMHLAWLLVAAMVVLSFFILMVTTLTKKRP